MIFVIWFKISKHPFYNTKRRASLKIHGTLRSLSQPPSRPQNSIPKKEEPTVYTLQFLPSSLVYPPSTQPPKKKVSFSSVSQPDLTKLTMTSPTMSRCSTPSMNISDYGSPIAHRLALRQLWNFIVFQIKFNRLLKLI